MQNLKIPTTAQHIIMPMSRSSMQSSNNKTRGPMSEVLHAFYDDPLWILWLLVCFPTLGFPAKYRERLRLFEGLYDIDNENYKAWKTTPIYSDRGHRYNSIKTLRQKQQEEWDRLNITMSVITATSAAALAIQSISSNAQIYWLVTAFYSIAFGLSLEGLILITHMTISAGGSSDEGIARLARGILVSRHHYRAPRLTAFIMALPAIFATYSSIALLAGLVAMVVVSRGEGVDTQSKEYILVSIIPVGIGFLLLCSAIGLCEIGTWVEIRGRRRTDKKLPNTEDTAGVPEPCCHYCCSGSKSHVSYNGPVLGP
ncbi:unnamed protein product [Rhizoctonia solani]|uniref:Uncharacterized protein n=1 Tax=Rhizoctonia solani TaxID=456999 RepID=A0A8H2X9B9_9AGAM|nr:unnamed protein product [Rhizoctonia solani]